MFESTLRASKTSNTPPVSRLKVRRSRRKLNDMKRRFCASSKENSRTSPRGDRSKNFGESGIRRVQCRRHQPLSLMSDFRISALAPAEAAAQERNWVSRVRCGDETALTFLIARHRNRLVRTATNLLRDSHEAEDV